MAPTLPIASTDQVGITQPEKLADFVSYDPNERVLTIDGVRFTREFFGLFTSEATGQTCRIVRNEHGVTFTRIPYDDCVSMLLHVRDRLRENVPITDVAPEDMRRLEDLLSKLGAAA